MGLFDRKINKFAEKLTRSINQFSEELASNLERIASPEEFFSSSSLFSRKESTPPALPEQQGVDYHQELESELALQEQQVKPTAVDFLSPRMQGLINAAVRDGVVTEAELSVLVRKGAEEGMDADEVLMVTNARLFEVLEEKKGVKQSASQPTPRKPRQPGKCPHCGAVNTPTATVCAECGKPLQNPVAPPPCGGDVASLVANVHRIADEGERQNLSESVILARQRQAIMAFPMPTVVEQLFELVVTAISEAEDDDDLEQAWLSRAHAALDILKRQYSDHPGVKEFVRKQRDELDLFF